MRVSRINTTAREKNQSIVQAGIAADAGLASPEKKHRLFQQTPAPSRVAGVFVFVGSHAMRGPLRIRSGATAPAAACGSDSRGAFGNWACPRAELLQADVNP